MSASPAMAPQPGALASRVVYFFTGGSPVAALAFERAAAMRPDLTWCRHVLRTPAEQREFESADHAPDLVISFLNGYVVKRGLLDAASGRAFNVHPAPPEYPGRDPWHFAYYDRFPRAGATLHRMTAKVDEGEILDVAECEFDPSFTVVDYRNLCHQLAVSLLLGNLDSLLAGTVERRSERGWRVEAKRSRRDFVRMCEIDPAMSPDEVARRVRSFNTPDHENVYVVIHGHKFFYKSSGR